MLGALAGPALLSQQLAGLPQAVMAAQAPGVITGRNIGAIYDDIDAVASRGRSSRPSTRKN